jgi:hypothetical protein
MGYLFVAPALRLAGINLQHDVIVVAHDRVSTRRNGKYPREFPDAINQPAPPVVEVGAGC